VAQVPDPVSRTVRKEPALSEAEGWVTGIIAALDERGAARITKKAGDNRGIPPLKNEERAPVPA